MDELKNPREGDGNALISRTKARVLGRSIADGGISDQPVAVRSNQARTATGTMVGSKGEKE